MEHFSKSQINKMDKIYRLNLVNSCTGYKSANLIGTVSENGIYNVAIFSSITHLGTVVGRTIKLNNAGSLPK